MKHEVGIYTTSAGTAGLYDRSHGRAGGAERQMTLLARALAERGVRVAHIVYAARDPVELDYPVTLVHRRRYDGGRRFVGALLEAVAIWRALAEADARVVVTRSASPAVGIAALYCRLHRRALVFSSSNVSDFTVPLAGRVNRALYRFGVRRADAVVVQSTDQRRQLAEFVSTRSRVELIPSVAEPARDAVFSKDVAQSFLWFGRAVPHKQPLKYVELARALPDLQFAMIPVPDGPSKPLLAEIERRAAEMGNLVLLDPLPHAKLASLVAQAVAVVNTSTHEGMPNAFLEAWAAGVPVLTLEFDPDGIVAEHELGISAGKSWERFVAGARELWDARTDRERVGARLRAYVAERHSPERAAAAWAQLVAELAATRRVTRRRVAARARPR